MKRQASITAFILGFFAVTGQIILMRELMVLFYGNELSTGMVLMTWLTWTALGSYIGGLMTGSRFKIGNNTLTYYLLAIGILLPLSILAVRISKTVIGISQGEVIGIGLIIIISAVTLLPLCLIMGSLFPATIDVINQEFSSTDRKSKGTSRKNPVGRIYLMEAIGSSVGGVIVSLILIRHFDSLTISFVLSLFVIPICLVQFLRANKGIFALFSVVVFLFFTSQLFDSTNYVGPKSRDYQWKGFSVMESVDSIYGNLTVTRTQGIDGQISLYDNGVLSFTYPDIMTTEEVHYPLLIHPNPESVLLVGGGISSSLSQILKHPGIITVDYVELDPMVIELGKEYLPFDATAFLDDPRVRVINSDGRLFIKETERKYDVVIVNVSDPINARLNRYYTLEFMEEVKGILKPSGLLSISATSSEEIISPTLASFLASIFSTIDAAFEETGIIPGGTAYFIASDDMEIVKVDPELMLMRMEERGIENIYVSEYYLPYKLNPERRGYIKDTINNPKIVRLNTDLKPIAYLYDMILWSLSLAPRTKVSLIKITGLETYHVLITLVIITIVFILFLTLIKGRVRSHTLLFSSITPSVLASGFSEIALEVVIIVAFQTFYGYVYYQIGLIITAFMIGLTVGTLIANRLSPWVKRPWLSLVVISVLYALYALLIIGLLVSFSKNRGTFSGLDILFSLLNFIGGVLGGLHFIYTSELLKRYDTAPGFSGGWIYGTDLVGSSMGALISSALLIPVLGLLETVFLVLIINLCAGAAVIFGAFIFRRI